jgi:hypothetical protein
MVRFHLAAAALAILAGSCAPAVQDPIDHPQGSEEIVLRVERSGVGPMHPMEVVVPRSPWFSLFGNGRVIVEDARQTGGFVSTFTAYSLPEDGVQRILGEARAAGLEGDDQELHATSGTDGDPTTYVTVVSSGSTHTTSAWNLEGTGEHEEGLDAETSRRRQALREFLARLADLEAWLGEDVLSGPESFDPDGWAAVWGVVRDPNVDAPWSEELVAEFRVRPWPLESPVALGDPHPRLQGIRCAVVRGGVLQELRRHIEEGTLWEREGVTYWLYARPLLPDEANCWAAHA